MKIRQFIWEQLRGPFVSDSGHVEYPETFYEELNDQCSGIIFVAALLATFAWLPFIPIDRQLYPSEPLIVTFRIGLSLLGLTLLVLQGLKRFNRYNLLFLTIIGAYLEIATGLITGLTKADPTYLGGYLLVLTLLALGPFPRRAAWSILAVSLLVFFTVGFAKGMQFDSASSRYSLNDLLGTVLIVAFFIYLLDRLRFNSWEKSRKIGQQNETLKSDKAKIDELLHNIRLSEARYRQLFDHSPIGIFLTTTEGKVLTANRAIIELLKFDSVDAVNATGLPNLYVDPKDRAALWEKVKNGSVSGYETLFRRADGELISVSIGGYLVYDEAGNAPLLEGTIEDITERKRAEEALRESEEKLRLIVNTIPHVVSIWDMNLRCSYVSPSIQRMLGYTPEEAMKLRADQLITPESMETAMKAYREDLELEQSPGFSGHNVRILELDELHKNGSVIPFENTITFLRDTKGVPVGIIILGTDITERKRAEEALRESEEKYRLLAENSNDVIWTTDTELRYTYYSPAVRKLRGLEPEEALRKTLAETVTPASLDALVSTYKRFLPDIEQGLNPTAFIEVEQYRKDGSTVSVEISMTTMRDDRGRLTGYVGVSRDISARKLAEEELRRRNILLSTQQEASIDGILVVDENGAIISFNRRFVEIWAIPGEVLESKSDERALQWVLGNLVDPDEFIAKVRHLYENRTETSRDEIAFKDGRIIDRYSAPMLGDDGKYYGRIWYFRDISERKRSEQALRESERRLADIINFLPTATMVIDGEGRVTAWNRAMEAITGVKREDMIGKGNYEYALPFYGDRRPILIDRVYNTGEELKSPYSNIRNEEGILTAEAFIPALGIILVGYASELHDSEGNVVGAIESVHNITDIRRVEAELKEAKKAADLANQSKSIFLANMSHEIRTPMNAILGFAQLMQRDPELSPQSREHLDIINRSGEHLLALINDILEMSKIEAGRATFIPNTFDLHSLLNDIELMFRVRTDAKRLRFLSEKVGNVPRWVITDEGKLRQILINLLGNAVKFTEEGGIALRLRATAGKADTVDLQFEVEDTGPGMAEEEIGRLFQAFEQTRAGIKSGGTGLGLALSRGFVQIMGGSISVVSAIGKGTTFRFQIPFREGKEEQTPPRESKRRVLGLRPGQGEIRVLIADDRETNRQLLSQLLAAVGFPVREVVNGEEAVRMVHEWKPQVVLMDMTMPVMDGYEATRRIKASPDVKNTAIIAVTASAFEEDKQRVYAAGADSYLAKPFKDAELFEKIGRLAGAEYLYEEVSSREKASKTVDDTTVLRKSVAALPSALVGQLRDAVESADLDRLNDLAAQLVTDHPAFAKRMQEMAARYEYEALIDLLSPGA